MQNQISNATPPRFLRQPEVELRVGYRKSKLFLDITKGAFPHL